MKLDRETLEYFNLIGQIQKAIQKAERLEEAISVSIKMFKEYMSSDYTIVWYMEEDGETLHPYYFVGDRDLTFVKRKIDGASENGIALLHIGLQRIVDHVDRFLDRKRFVGTCHFDSFAESESCKLRKSAVIQSGV